MAAIPRFLKKLALTKPGLDFGSDAVAQAGLPGVPENRGQVLFDNPAERAQGLAQSETQAVQPQAAILPNQIEEQTVDAYHPFDKSGNIQPQVPNSEKPLPQAPTQFEPAGVAFPAPKEVQPSFAEASTDQYGNTSAASPRLTKLGKLVGMLIAAGKGAAIGSQYQNFGQGFQGEQQNQQQQTSQRLSNQKEKAQVDLMTNTTPVRDQYGNVYQVPRSAIPAFLKTAIGEQGKDKRNQANIDSRENIAGDKSAQNYRKQGLVSDGKGGYRPLTYDEMSPVEQAHNDLQQAQTDAQQARADLDKAKNDPNSAQFKIAWGRYQTSAKNAATAAGKLGLDEKKYMGDYFGLDGDGNALPGAPADNNGNPVGIKTAGLTKPTTDQRNKAATADSVIETGQRLLDQLKDPNIRNQIGPAMSRYTKFEDLLGNLPPKMAGLKTNMGSMAAFTAGLHPVRGIGAIQHFDEVFNGPKGVRSPEALEASIHEMIETAKKIKARGSMSTVHNSNGVSPQDEAEQFLKAHGR